VPREQTSSLTEKCKFKPFPIVLPLLCKPEYTQALLMDSHAEDIARPTSSQLPRRSGLSSLSVATIALVESFVPPERVIRAVDNVLAKKNSTKSVGCNPA
jgi:hypothetical protein